MLERQEVEDEQFVFELAGQVQQQLHRLERLQATENSRHGAQHAGLGAVAYDAVACGLRPNAAQARGAGWTICSCPSYW